MSDGFTTLAFAVLTGSLIWLAWRRKDLLYPPLVFSIPLVVQYGCYGAFLRSGYRLDHATNTLILLTPLAFTVGCLATEAVSWHSSAEPSETRKLVSKRLLTWVGVFGALGVAGFLLGAVSAIRVGLNGYDDFFVNLRLVEITTRDTGIRISTHLLWFLHVAVLILLMTPLRRPLYRLGVLAAVIMLLFSPVFIMSRAAFLYILVPIVCAWYLSSRYVRHVRLHVGRLLTVGAGVLCIFVSLACLFNHLRKGSAGGSFLFTYFCNPLLAFDAVVLRGDFHTSGGYVLYPLLRVASALRGKPMPDTDIGLVSTDFNVFTCMGGPYLDFGPTGMVLVFLLLGMAYGVLYAWVRRGYLFSAVFYAVVVSPLVMSFYTYAFGLLWVYYGALVLFLAVVEGIDGWRPARRVPHA